MLTSAEFHLAIKAACHCGAIHFEVTLSAELDAARRCTFSFRLMRRRRRILVGVRRVSGQHKLTRSASHTDAAQRDFHLVHGLYTHQQCRSKPRQFRVDCLAGVSPFDFREVTVLDGVLHPSDAPAGTPDRTAGGLRFLPAD